MIIPSIDIMDGKAVQLKQGKEKVLEKEDVFSLAKEFRMYGEIAVIDLDSALSKGSNLELIKKLCEIADCRVGGGIRDLDVAESVLRAGARKIIIGTNRDIEFLKKLPKERVILAIDTKDGIVVDKGWTNKTGKTPEEVIKELEEYCSEFLFTNVNKEGMMSGFDLEKVKELKKLTKNKITVAGGITTKEDIQKIEELGFNSQIGMALYTGKIKLDETFISLLDFEKMKGLIPTIAQDVNGTVLMLAYSTKESLKQAFSLKKGSYYSRSRECIWVKGDTSGNSQELLRVRYDCDKDTLLFTVKQKNSACHLGTYSCFSDKEFSFDELFDVIKDRVENFSSESYTSKISSSEEKIKEKIREESLEVLEYKDDENLVWEIADLSYFLMVLMAKKGITLKDIKNELWRRRK